MNRVKHEVSRATQIAVRSPRPRASCIRCMRACMDLSGQSTVPRVLVSRTCIVSGAIHVPLAYAVRGSNTTDRGRGERRTDAHARYGRGRGVLREVATGGSGGECRTRCRAMSPRERCRRLRCQLISEWTVHVLSSLCALSSQSNPPATPLQASRAPAASTAGPRAAGTVYGRAGGGAHS